MWSVSGRIILHQERNKMEKEKKRKRKREDKMMDIPGAA
jgi:hypothetical protein